MRATALALVLLLVPAAGGVPASQTSAATDADLEAGVRDARQGDFAEAVVRLDAAVARLSSRASTPPKTLARAYVYLAVAHRGLGQVGTAKAKLREALRVEATLSVTTREFPPVFVAFFEEVRKEFEASLPRPASKGKGGPSVGLILGGVGLGAGGVLLATRGGEPSPSPSPSSPSSVTLEVLSVPGDGRIVLSRTSLERGVTYMLRASGMLPIGGAGYGDAEYNFDIGAATGLDSCQVGDPVDIGIGVNDAVNSGRKFPSWGPYNSAHVYTVQFVGLGAPVALNYHDCAYQDNSGSLTVEIIR
jgi:hypothetical protein